MATQLARQATDFLRGIGCQATNLVPDCAFTWRAEDQSLKNQTADLVAFFAAPHTMRTACVGVFTAAGRADVETFLQRARFLTAPLAIIGTPENVSLYSVRRDAVPAPVESAPVAEWASRFRSRLSDLSPDRLYAAKNCRERTIVTFRQWPLELGREHHGANANVPARIVAGARDG